MTAAEAETRRIVYDDDVVRAFSIITVIWGAVALLLGVIIASQISFWQANFGLSWLTFGRLRPLHTNAAIFAFVGNMMFAGIYYSTQRLVKARMASNALSWIHFWGWQLIIVAAAVTLPLGMSQGKEYAELIWPIDIAIAVVWVVFAVNFFWTLAKRNEKHLYVAIWFYIATIVTIAVLHIVNSLHLPTSFTHSYPIWAGVQDALVQWWYGHNAVAFFLTTPILGIMYYFLPKAAERPVYSYRLSVVHFWSLVFLYIWAGPHHLLYTALPDWAQTLGVVFSVMLWAPSWGGMLNGLLTLRGAWDKLRTDPVIKFFVVAVTFYGMSTFEGPLLSIKSVSALGHYTDWIVGHAHGGALGWNAFMTFGMLYWLVPRLWKRELYSKKLADFHFWISTLGLLLYVASMWIAGISQGLYWRALDAEGFLKYPDFVQSITASQLMYQTRLVGGILFLTGFLVMIYNVIKTVSGAEKITTSVDVVRIEPATGTTTKVLFGMPAILSIVVVVLGVVMGVTGHLGTPIVLLLIAVVSYLIAMAIRGGKGARWHKMAEGNSMAFTVLVLLAVLAGGIVEIIPTVLVSNQVPVSLAGSPYLQQPYSPLEVEGRDIYIREGCYNCHSQMIRPFKHETLRYGDYSRLEEFIYDHPFQWGSKRTGPDLHRVGGKYPNQWHYLHMMDPRSTSPGSNMPSYTWLKDAGVDVSKIGKKMHTLRALGVPYTEEDIASAGETALSQGALISADLATGDVALAPDSELTAMIAYLQRMGRGPQPLAAEPVVIEPEVEEIVDQMAEELAGPAGAGG